MLNYSFFALPLLSIFGGTLAVEPATSSLLERVDAQVPNLGTYHGVHIENNFTAPVLAWLGVDYVKQPVGDLRFRRPQKLEVYKGHPKDNVINATQFGLACLQSPLAIWPTGEGCLNLNIYRPAGIPLEKKLPVAFYVHGVSDQSTLISRARWAHNTARGVSTLVLAV